MLWWHCWFGDRKGIQCEKPVTFVPKGCVCRNPGKKTKVELDGPGCPGKWPITGDHLSAKHESVRELSKTQGDVRDVYEKNSCPGNCLLLSLSFFPSVLRYCRFGVRKSIRPVKIEWWGADVVICLEQGANDWAYGPANATTTRSSLASLKSRFV